MLAKILKWLTNSKTKSYQIKYVIDSVLHNKRNISEEEIGVTLLEVIDYFTIRGTEALQMRSSKVHQMKREKKSKGIQLIVKKKY